MRQATLLSVESALPATSCALLPTTVFPTASPERPTVLMPMAAQDDDRAADVEGKTRRPRAAASKDDAKYENPTPVPRQRRAATTTATRTIRLLLAAVLVGSLRSFLTDRRQMIDGRSIRRSSIGSSNVVAVSGPPLSAAAGSLSLEGGARGGVPPSFDVDPPSSGKDDETAHLNAINSNDNSSPSDVVTATAEVEEDGEVGHASSTATNTASMCSCFNSFSNRTCCARTVLRAHKFGHVLAAEWFGDLEESGDLDLTLVIDPEYLPSSRPKNVDYRHVVMVRNFTDAFVSGYLYHKSGRECWLDPEGRPNGKPPDRQFNLLWGRPVRIAQERHPRFGQFPPKRDRGLCQYLIDESERDGMKVYVAVALHRWYDGLEAYLRQTKKASVAGSHTASNSSSSRSFFVCLEDASDPRYEKAWYDAAMHHLYPGSVTDGGGRYQHLFPKPAVVAKEATGASATSAADTSSISSSPYQGGHATSHDPELRQRLTQLVTDLDRDVFDGRISIVDKLIGCGGTAATTAPP